ncbi:MAG TPA: Crp/Fnr family transcriptional regulator, partial [Steroidobacteraceae bacterium]|nr:Crp/Fnr family transcriptional regulator [Steroidobacteraceae bacterium]
MAVADNLLLAALAAPERNSLISGTEPVVLRAGDSLAEAGKRLAHVYFPIDSSISLAVPVAGHPPLEVGLVGFEGMLGIALVLGASGSAFSAVVQGAGCAWRVDADRFKRELAENRSLRLCMNAYVHVRLLQVAQTAACKNFHLVEARLARWLLMSRDRARSDRISLTHEMLSHLLGVRRAGVTLAAHAFQKQALISYVRGQIVLLDARGLEAVACPCYAGE